MLKKCPPLSPLAILIVPLLLGIGCSNDANRPGNAEQPFETDESIQEEVEAGYSGRGEGYGGSLRQLYQIQDRLVVIQIRHALDLYEALNGCLPQSTESFMEEIIQENDIPLEDPPEGRQYVWDPEAEAGEGRKGVLYLENIADGQED